MNKHIETSKENKSQSLNNELLQMKQQKNTPFQFIDNRPEAIAQRKMQERVIAKPENQLIQRVEAKKGEELQLKAAPKENNTGLPDRLKSGVENLSGMALDDVKVHYNSTKPAQLQAHAYAQGSEIHLAPGQEKHLPHEAWHVAQQKQGRVNPTMQMKGEVNVNDDEGLEKEADRMGAMAFNLDEEEAPSDDGLGEKKEVAAFNNVETVQAVKKSILVTGVSHLVKLKDNSLQDGVEEREVHQGQELVIDDSKKLLSRRGPNQEIYAGVDDVGPQHYEWFRVESLENEELPKDLYIRKDVFEYKKLEESGSKLDTLDTVVNEVTKVPATLIGNEGITGLADALNDKTVHTSTAGGPGATASDKEHAANMGIVGDSITGVTGLIGLAKGFKDLGNPDATVAELIESGLAIEQGAMKTGEAVSKLVHTASGSSEATTASKFGSAFEGYGGAFAGIKEGFTGMRKLVTLINDHQDFSTEEKAQQAAQISLHALESAKGIVLSVKAFIELVSGGASGGLMAAVPGLDIAISAGKLIMDGYYLIVSNSNRKLMNERRHEIVASKGDKDLHGASEFYRTKDAEIANKRAVIKEDEERIKESNNPILKSRLKERIKKLQGEIKLLAAEKSDIAGREDVAEYTMATELRDANTKRVTRQGIHIATEMAKIAGSIATLTGVGATGGAVVKGAAAAVDLALPATRMAKQAGRDRAGRKKAKDKDAFLVDAFDHTKSTAAKTDFRTKQVKYLIKMIVDLSYKNPQRDAGEFQTVLNYLKASGVSQTKLFKENGNPQKQLKILLDAIQQREF